MAFLLLPTTRNRSCYLTRVRRQRQNSQPVQRIRAPVASYPAHWAPVDVMFYSGSQFPARYKGGAFIAFHGSWNRAPLPQAPSNVTFQPFAGGKPSGKFEIFAGGFAARIR